MYKHAFSLIELMIVITIIGILAAVAVPSYRDYVNRTKVAATLPILNDLKTRAAEYYNINNAFPTSIADVGLASSTYGNPLINSSGIVKTCMGLADSGSSGGWCAFLRLNTAQLTDNFDPPTSTVLWLHLNAYVEANNTLRWTCTTGKAVAQKQYSIPSAWLPGSCSAFPD